MQREPHAVVLDRLAVGQRLQVDVGAEPRAQHACAVGVRQVVAVADARVVGVGMRDDGALHRPPGIDVEIAGRAVQAFRTGDDEIHARALEHGSQCRATPARWPARGRGAPRCSQQFAALAYSAWTPNGRVARGGAA